MNILLIGSGGREHALAWKIAQSPLLTQLFIAPGNPGTATCGENLNIAVTEFDGIAQACKTHAIDMVICGPEEPLVKGLYEFLQTDELTKNIAFIGPDAKGAALEGSKAFAKAFMQQYNIPTAAYREFTAENFDDGIAYLEQHSLPIVLKADGLAAGKGVLICASHKEAIGGFTEMIRGAKFGDASAKVVVEEFLSGIEMSCFVLTDGDGGFVILPEAKDYKRIGEGDTGLNTGGMGAVSPVPFFDEVLRNKVLDKVVIPTVHGIQERGFYYKGFVFIGLMIMNGEPYVIEYNCRMGDPETEVVLPRLETDLLELLHACAQNLLADTKIRINSKAAVGIVAVSGGYPEEFEKGKVISEIEGKLQESQLLFQAGTKKVGDDIVTSGGRVLVAVSFADSVGDAAKASRMVYEAVKFDDMYFRKDIGWEFFR